MGNDADNPAGASHGASADADLRLLADGARDFAMIFTDPERRVVRWSRGAEAVLGWTEAEAIGASEIDLIFTPEDKAAGVPRREQDAALRDGRGEDERWHLRKDGSRFWASGVLVPLFDPGTGALRGFGKVLRDVTDRKALEERLRATADELRASEAALRESEGRARALVDHLPGGAAFVIGPDLRYRFAGGEALRAAGTAPADLVGKTVAEAVGPELAALYEPLFRGALERGEPFAHEHDAHGRSYVSRGAPLRDATGRVYAVLAVSYDITERRRSEEALGASAAALRASEERLAVIFARAPVGMSEVSLGGRFLRVNDELCRLLGRPPEEVLELSAIEVTHPDDVEPSWDALAQAAAGGGPATLDKRYIRPDGTAVWASSTVTLLRGDGARPPAFLVVTADLTERKRYEEWLRRTNEFLEERVGERTAALAERTAELAEANLELRAEVARRERAEEARRGLTRRVVEAQEEERRRISQELHDQMGQLLTGVSLGLRAVADAFAAPDLAAAAAAGLPRLAGLRGLVEEMGREMHRLAVELRPTALDDVGLVPALEAYCQEWSGRTGAPAEFAAVGMGAGKLPPLIETTVYRVVQEALNNAAKYAVAPGHAGLRVSVTLQRRGPDLRVTVEDDGPGFDPEEAARRGRLGLAGMRERAELAGGTLEVETAPGEGTTIFLRVPLPEPPA